MNSVGKKYVVYVYAPFLEEIESMGSGNVVIDGILKSDSLAIKIAGSGNFSGQLNVESLTLKSMGSGNFRLRGNVMNAITEIFHAQKYCSSKKIVHDYDEKAP